MSWMLFLQCVMWRNKNPSPFFSLLLPLLYSLQLERYLLPYSSKVAEETCLHCVEVQLGTTVSAEENFQRGLKFFNVQQALYCLDLATHSNEI